MRVERRHGKKIAVIENEFGEVNIDSSLVTDNLKAKEDVISMDNGYSFPFPFPFSPPFSFSFSFPVLVIHLPTLPSMQRENFPLILTSDIP